MITQRRLIRDEVGREREVAWDVDTSVLAETQKWARDEARVERELRAMTEMYPAWTLTLAIGAKPLTRHGGGDLPVPTGGAWRWASDGAPLPRDPQRSLLETLTVAICFNTREDSYGASGMMWEGLLPAPLAGLDRARKKLSGKFPVETINGRPWTTVPVRVCYPDQFPRSEPEVYYDERWTGALKLGLGGSLHLLGYNRLCLFYPGHWKRGYSVADVLSQRVVNHMFSMLKVANGMSSADAFIGRIHNEAWRPTA